MKHSLDSQITLSSSVRQNCVPSLSLCDDLEQFSKRDRDLNQVHFGVLLKGQVDVLIPEIGTRSVKAGEWFLLADYVVHSTLSPLSTMDALVVSVPMKDLNPFQGQIGSSMKQMACLKCSKRETAFFQFGKSDGRMIELTTRIVENSFSDVANEFIRISNAFELLARIFQQPQISRPAPCRRLISRNDVKLVEGAAEYLRENLSEDHSLNDICKYCYINEFKLKKGFKEHFGTTVFGYLRQKRMERAKELLESGTSSVLEVATEVGYSNASHFARAFKDVYSVNPSQVISLNHS